ncbi:hypothetical protein [Allonocardiopsis opalescens]|uniref:DUF308 domain-containing protein n=1 Tax=Allonocardiopsis opalescens TaxID=1144618 RepID=A0A2T0Q030_9ACTN|nr:hypothetical protein [Allonocardiopsis opalescens]PRX97023.1 hypothetical protein CLV72_10659 [Allonocardiopsis opalescens]
MTRRGNGLHADSYEPLADLAPEHADAMLEALREAGVAAYAVPAPRPGGAAVELAPTDQLFVDSRAHEQAAEVLEALLPLLRDDGDEVSPLATEIVSDAPAVPDEDAVWRDLVDRFNDGSADRGDWPEREDLPEGSDGDDGPTDLLDPPGSAPARSARRVVRGADESDAADDDEDHYTPPPPPPIPRGDLVSRLAWTALFAGPLFLIVAMLVRWDMPGWLAFAAVAAFIGGFVVLVLRMGDQPPSDSGPDDGAVI